MSITSFNGGFTTNVIPSEVKLMGTFRAMNEEWRFKAHELIIKQSTELVQSMGGEIDIKIDVGYPFVLNNERLNNVARKKGEEYVGKQNVEETELRMGAEDFAYYSHQIPGCFFRIGAGNKAKGITSGVHTPTFNIDENAIEKFAQKQERAIQSALVHHYDAFINALIRQNPILLNRIILSIHDSFSTGGYNIEKLKQAIQQAFNTAFIFKGNDLNKDLQRKDLLFKNHIVDANNIPEILKQPLLLQYIDNWTAVLKKILPENDFKEQYDIADRLLALFPAIICFKSPAPAAL